MYKKKRWMMVLVLCLILFSLFTITALAATGDVAGAIENTWDTAKTQIKQVINNVVFPVIDLILAVLFFAKIAMSYMDYRKHGQFEFCATRF